MENPAAGGLTSADDRRPELRSPPRPLRVLAVGRRRPDRGAEVPSGRSDHLHGGRAPRHVRGGRHGSRRDVRRAPLLRGRARRRHQADHRRRGLRRAGLAVRAEPRRERGEVPPPHAPGGERDGVPEPAEARVGRLPGGLLPPAAHGQGAARRARRGRDLPVGMSVERAVDAAARRAGSPRAGGGGTLPRHLRSRSLLHGAAGSRHPGPAAGAPEADRARTVPRHPARRDERPPLHGAERREAARRAALHPAAEAPERSEAVEVRLGGVLPEERAGDATRLPRAPRCVRQHAADRGARRARPGVRGPGAGGSAVPPAAVRDAGSQGTRGVPARARVPGRTRSVPHAHGRHPPPDRRRARRHHADGVRRLLPDRVGPDPVRARERDPRGAGSRLGGRLRGVVLPADHRPRPAALRPDLRAVPEPRPPFHAGHRHGLRRAPARRGDPLRDRAVRLGPRGADHHVPDDQGEAGHPRRRARAGVPGRRRRPPLQDVPAHRDGPRLPDRGRAEGIAGVPRGLREGARGEGDRRHRSGARGSAPRGLGARGRRRDRRRAARELPPAEALEGLARRLEAHRDAVRHDRRRGARPAEDGLPGPADAVRDRRHASVICGRATSSWTSITSRWTTRRRTPCSRTPTRPGSSRWSPRGCAR